MIQRIDMDAVLDHLSGPAGGFVFTLVIFYGGFLLITKHLLPMAARHLDESDERFREMMDQHIKDRDTFKGSVRRLSTKHEVLHAKVEVIHDDVKGLRDTISNTDRG